MAENNNSELNFNREEGQDDNDFDYDNQDKNDKEEDAEKLEEKTKKIDNQPFDEFVELSDQGSEIQSSQGSQNNAGKDSQQEQQQQQRNKQATGKPEELKTKAQQIQDNDEEKGGSSAQKEVQGAYNPNDYLNLQVTSEIEELFKYITRYKPQTIDIDAKLKAFIPDYIPTVGEVDAFIKMPRADEQQETLGLIQLDEPALNQSKKAKLDLLYNEYKKKKKSQQQTVHSIENAAKNPKEIMNWIKDVQEIQGGKQPPSVSYSKPMPDIDNLMQVWPVEIEDALQNIKLPSSDIDLNLEDYCKFACALLDIPVYKTNNSKNIIESLHVFFTLFSEFKANQHFMQQNKEAFQGTQQQTFEVNNN